MRVSNTLKSLPPLNGDEFSVTKINQFHSVVDSQWLPKEITPKLQILLSPSSNDCNEEVWSNKAAMKKANQSGLAFLSDGIISECWLLRVKILLKLISTKPLMRIARHSLSSLLYWTSRWWILDPVCFSRATRAMQQFFPILFPVKNSSSNEFNPGFEVIALTRFDTFLSQIVG